MDRAIREWLHKRYTASAAAHLARVAANVSSRQFHPGASRLTYQAGLMQSSVTSPCAFG